MSRRSLPILLGLMALVLASPSWALSPPAAAFLTSIGLDPASPDVKAADADGEITAEVNGDPETFSLEGLALARKPNAVRQFVVTRTFLHRLRKDFAGTPLPAADYNANFLTPEERQLVGRKVASTLTQ